MAIAFLGAGMMGAGMVEAALARGEQVTVWNRTLEKARPLTEKGARLATTPAEAAAGAERVHIMLSDDGVVDGALEPAAPGIGREALVIDHTTTSPAGTAARAAACEARGVGFLHAPVFMSPAMCRDAKGLMLCAGPKARFDRAEPALAKMTGQVWWVGERSDLAASYKLFGNAMLITICGGLADVFSMAAHLGIPPADALGLFAKFNPAGVIQARGSWMAKGQFSPASFELSMARKDVRLMLESAGDLPLSALPGIAARMDALLAEGRGAEDLAVLAADAIGKGGG
ncbi:MAG TPA: NAD(P)-binding domain-containing protein [Candidatus Nanopelagicales bacterium]|nr:NAD(P)-binding domain-containing protein [Candidatus Nanopelagicales bacterium]